MANNEAYKIKGLADLKARQEILHLRLEKNENEITYRFYYLKKNSISIILHQFFPQNSQLSDKVSSLIGLGLSILLSRISDKKDDAGESLLTRWFNWIAEKLGSWFGKR